MKKPTRRLLSILLTLTMLLGLLPAMNLTALAANGVEIIRVGDTEVAADDTNVTAPTAFVGQYYELQLSASKSSDSDILTWSNPHTPLPAGLNLDSATGLISGMPEETAYSASYTIKVTNGTDSDSILVSFNCCEEADKPTIDTSALPTGYVGSNYSGKIDFGGMYPFESEISAGTLPPGLEFNKSQGTGAYIRGTPTTAGTYTFTVWVKNAAGETTKEFTMTIGNANVPPSIETTGALDYGVVGKAYSYQLIATGTNTESNPIKWSITSGALPAGLSLDVNTGRISGTPTVAGTGQADIRAMNKAADGITNQAASASVSIAVYGQPAIEARSLPNGTLGQSYSGQAIVTTDATEVAVTSGSLPKGMTLERRGDNWSALSGTPTETGTFNFTVTATRKVGDDLLGTASQEYPLVIDGPAITTASLPNATQNSSYNAQLTCTSVGDLTKTWSVESGNLPAGLSLDGATGVISGTPTGTGKTDFTVWLTVSNYSVDKELSITVDEQPAEVEPPAIVSESQSLPYAVIGREYSHQFTATGTQPITWSVSEGSLPAGLTLNASTGLLSGTPTGSGGQSSFTIEATNINSGGQKQTSSKCFLMQVYAPPAIEEKTLSHGALGQYYSSQSIDTTDATEIAVIGSLPAGMTLERKGDNWSALSGTPAETGTFKFQVTATRKVGDDVIGTASQEYTLVIDGPAITTASLPNATQNSSYNAQLTCTSVGDLTKAWSVAVGNLPDGLSLNGATGVISGTPTVTGTFNFTARLTVSNYSVDKELSITVETQPETTVKPDITGSSALPYAVVGREYSHQFTATGTQPITWSVSEGSSLPDGLSLDAKTGILSGNPTKSSIQDEFYLTAFNSAGSSDSERFYMQVYAPPAIEEKTLPDGKLNISYSPVCFAVENAYDDDTVIMITGGALPKGMSLTSGGYQFYIVGTPTEYGTFTFQVTATRTIGTDVIGTDTRVLTLKIEGPPAAPTFTPPSYTSFMDTLNVNIYCDTPGAVIYFTMDGTDPSTSGSREQYTGEFMIYNSCTIKAIAYKSSTGFYSEIVSAEYTKVDSPAAPTASPEPGNFVGSTAVTLSCATNNTTIYYTTDGSEPVKGSGTSLIYSSPIAISADTTIKARAYLATDLRIYSGVAEFTYTKVEGYSVSGKVASYNPGNATTVQLKQGDAVKYTTTIAATTGSGQVTQSFSIEGVAAGTYDLVVTKAGHLTYTITGVKVESGNVDLTVDTSKAYSTITLLAGNMDGNNAINLQDLNQFRSNFGKAGSSITNSNADIDGNATVNLQDLNVFRSNFGKTTTDCTKPYTE